MGWYSCSYTRHYCEGGQWTNHADHGNDGYAGSTSTKHYYAVIKFTTPSTDTFSSNKRSIAACFKWPYVRDLDSRASSGTFYYKLFETSDHTQTTRPTDTDNDGSVTWSCLNEYGYKDRATHSMTDYVSVDSLALKADTTYCLAIYSSKLIQIGYKNEGTWAVYLSTYTEIGTGSVSVEDNYNNSFTITGRAGGSTDNNDASSAKIWWALDSNDTGNYETEDFDSVAAPHRKTIKFPPTTTATREIAAAVTTVGTQGDRSDTGWQEFKIMQYTRPSNPTNLSITSNKSRLTTKATWKLNWDKVSGDASSPVKGYQIRLFRTRGDESEIQLPIRNSKGQIMPKGITADDYYYNVDAVDQNVISCSIYPSKYGDEIQPGDKIRFSVISYTKLGQDRSGTMYFSTTKENASFSTEYTVQNAGIVRVKVGNTWKEGQVYVKVNNEWKEAECIKTKVAGVWKESE